MAIFDIIMENLLSGPIMSKKIRSVIDYIYGDKIKITDSQAIMNSLKKCKGVNSVEYLLSIDKSKGDKLHCMHRFFVEDSKGVIYVISIYNKPGDIFINAQTQVVYDESNCVIPRNICKDFLREYVSLAKRKYLGVGIIQKDKMGFYIIHPSEQSPEYDMVIDNYSNFSKSVDDILKKIESKYPKELKQKNLNLLYIGDKK